MKFTSQIIKAAHALAKQAKVDGYDYRASFGLILKHLIKFGVKVMSTCKLMNTAEYINWEYIQSNGGFSADDVEGGFFERICQQVAHAMGRQITGEDHLSDDEKDEVLAALQAEYLA